MATTEEENQQVLNLVQAMLGAISSNFRAVSIRCNEIIELTFLLEKDIPQDREEIEDIEFEFLALQPRLRQTSTHIVATSDPVNQIQLPGRLVYLRREPVE